jgi:hypothetical protein
VADVLYLILQKTNTIILFEIKNKIYNFESSLIAMIYDLSFWQHILFKLNLKSKMAARYTIKTQNFTLFSDLCSIWPYNTLL